MFGGLHFGEHLCRPSLEFAQADGSMWSLDTSNTVRIRIRLCGSRPLRRTLSRMFPDSEEAPRELDAAEDDGGRDGEDEEGPPGGDGGGEPGRPSAGSVARPVTIGLTSLSRLKSR